MSRRRPRSSADRLVFMCTGRGKHPKRVMATSLVADAEHGEAIDEKKGGRLVYMKGDNSGMHGAYALKCPSCGRDERLNFDRAARLMGRAVSEGLRTIDVSYL